MISSGSVIVEYCIFAGCVILIILAYWCFPRYSYKYPFIILAFGLFFILFSFNYKALFLKILPLAMLPTDATYFIDISTAAIGGSLIAAAMVLKAQILHNEHKISLNNDIVYFLDHISMLTTRINEIADNRLTMDNDEVSQHLSNLVIGRVEMEEKLDKLRNKLKSLNVV